MKNMKFKALSLSILSIVIISSNTVFAATDANDVNNDSNISYRSVFSESNNQETIEPLTHDPNVDLGFWDAVDTGGIIQTGNAGLAVKQLQFLLRWQGYKVNLDGKFGTQTYNAVKSFQEKNKLIQDGKVGKATKNKFVDLAGGRIDLYWNIQTGVAFIMNSNSEVVYNETVK